jgi:hypothetical protein
VATAVNLIVSGLWVGYASANILKWHWWRLNGFGYFWGMIVGICGAIATALSPDVKTWFAYPSIWLVSSFTDTQGVSFNSDLMAFPTLFVLSLVATVAGALLTRPEDESQLVDFYTRTRPWGWWGPIRAAALRRNPRFQPNRDFARDMFNVAIGIVWQTAFVAIAIYIVIHEWQKAALCLATILITSAILKRTWYDRLERA